MSSKTSLGFAEKKEIYSTNCLIVFVHFVGLALKGWKSIQHEWSTFYTPCESLPQFVLVYKNWFFFLKRLWLNLIPQNTVVAGAQMTRNYDIWLFNLRNRSIYDHLRVWRVSHKKFLVTFTEEVLNGKLHFCAVINILKIAFFHIF